MFLLLTLGCTCGGPRREPTSVDFGAPTLREVTTRFDDQDVAPLEAERAFSVVARCPVLTRAELVPDGANQARLRLIGRDLSRVVRVGGALPDGRLVDLRPSQEDGAMVVPILAPTVEIWLGVQDGSLYAACRGPGYSLDIEDWRLTP